MEGNETLVNASQTGVESQPEVTTAPVVDEGAKADPAEQQPIKQAQSEEQNRIAAQARRAAETQAAALQKQLDMIVKYAGHEDVGALISAIESEQAAQYKAEHGVDPAAIDQRAEAKAREILQSDPVYRQMVEQNQMQLLNAALTEVKALDPAIDTVDALVGFINDPKVLPLINAGVSPAEAYKVLNHEKLIATAAEKARVEALKSVQRNAEASPGAVGTGADPITFTDEQLRNPDKARLVKDDAYYSAYLQHLPRLYKK